MSEPLSKARLARLRAVMNGHVASGRVPGLVALVARRGAIHVEAIGTRTASGSDAVRRDTIFRIASMTKPIAAAAAMILVEECKLRLDDPVDPFLPELANRKVLKRIDGPLDDTVPAERPITLRDLLTFRMGVGLALPFPGRYPIQKAIQEAGVAPGPNPAPFGPDEWMKRLGALPLIHQPGEVWMYHTGSDVLGVLIARASGQTLGDFLRERLFEPLGMRDTGFHVPPEKMDRLSDAFVGDFTTGALTLHDPAKGGLWSHPPAFQSGGAGLVSTADDYYAFCRMLLNKGQAAGGRILSRPSVELMITDQLTPEQKAGPHDILNGRGWGFGLGVVTRRDDLPEVPGRFGWDGGLGTSGWSDPAEDLVGVLMTSRAMDSPNPPAHFRDFWTCAYAAIGD
jgi:CubicO group peptidase (beta-lactamase class C family)